jgi:hypothetical protein
MDFREQMDIIGFAAKFEQGAPPVEASSKNQD